MDRVYYNQKYKPEFIEQVEKLAATGDTTSQIAAFFEVSRKNLFEWMNKHPEFRAALQRGRDRFRMDGVEKSLLKRVLGYYYYEETYGAKNTFAPDNRTKIPILDASGRPEMTLEKKVKKHVPADPTLMMMYLTNRDPNRWKHIRRMEIQDLMGMNDDGQLSDSDKKEAIEFAHYRAEKLLRESQAQAKELVDKPVTALRMIAAAKAPIEEEIAD